MEGGHYPMNHQFAAANYGMSPHHAGLESSQCQLTVRQQPKIARVALGEEKNRKPVDPPPIVQLRIKKEVDPEQSYLQSPYFFVSCNLVQPVGSHAAHPSGTSLAGTLVSSLHRLKDSDNTEGAFFIFGDLSVKLEGIFALQFNLYEMRENECFHIHSIASEPFTVHGPKQFPGLSESTALTRSFSEQGVRLRVRKEPRTLLRKRGPASDNYVPRSYNRHRLQHETSEEQIGEDDSPVSSRHSQAEQQVSMQSPQQMGPGREYSQQSFGSYPEEPVIKRPRTGSEQGQQQGFGQQGQQHPFAQQSQQMAYGGQQRPAQLVTPLAAPDQESKTRRNSDDKQSPYYTQQSQQQQYFGGYIPSHTATRDGYFAQQRFTPPQGPISPSHQQPASAFSSQTHAQYQQSYGGQLSSTPTMPGVPNTYVGMGMGDGARHSEMAAPGFSRTEYGSTMGGHGDRRASYIVPVQGFPNPNQNVSAGMGMGTSRSPSTQPITTGPGSMDSTYQ